MSNITKDSHIIIDGIEYVLIPASKIGRPTKTNDAVIYDRLQQGAKADDLAAEYNVSKRTIWRAAARQKARL